MKKNYGRNLKRDSIFKSSSGFGLLELLTVTVVVSVMSAIAVPNFTSWRQNAQLSSTAQGIYANFQKAKVEAIKRNTDCTISFGLDNYVIFIDTDHDFVQDAGEEVIKTVSFPDYGAVIYDTDKGGGDGLTFGNPANGIAFSPTGLPKSAAGVGTGSIFLKNLSNKTASVDVSPSGSVRVN